MPAAKEATSSRGVRERKWGVFVQRRRAGRGAGRNHGGASRLCADGHRLWGEWMVVRLRCGGGRYVRLRRRVVERHRERAEERERRRAHAVVCAWMVMRVIVRVGLVVRRGDVRGEVELGLGRERHARREGLGRAREREALGGGLGVDVHLARVDRPARAEGRACAARVALVVCARGEVRVGGARRGEEGVVVGEEVRLGDGELEVEDVEELTLDATDIPLAEDHGAERPMDVLQCGIVQVLQSKSQYGSR